MPNNPASRKAGATQVSAANKIVRRGAQAATVATATSSLKDNIAAAAADETPASTPATSDFPPGGIIMWAGLLADIPSGWNLCDGTNSTPDLRDRFIYGWTAGVDPGSTGGATTHSHTEGSLANSSTSGGTPAGTNSAPTFTGASLNTHNHTATGLTITSDSAGTPAGSIDAHTTAADTAVTGAGTRLTGPGTHAFTGSAMGTHTHTLGGTVLAASAGTPAGTVSAPTFTGSALAGHTHTITGTTATASSLPPYLKLAFLQKAA